jgi:hypothetical protein
MTVGEPLTGRNGDRAERWRLRKTAGAGEASAPLGRHAVTPRRHRPSPASRHQSATCRAADSSNLSYVNAGLCAFVRSGASHAAEAWSTATARTLVRRMAFTLRSLPASAVATSGGIATAIWQLVSGPREGSRCDPARRARTTGTARRAEHLDVDGPLQRCRLARDSHAAMEHHHFAAPRRGFGGGRGCASRKLGFRRRAIGKASGLARRSCARSAWCALAGGDRQSLRPAVLRGYC